MLHVVGDSSQIFNQLPVPADSAWAEKYRRKTIFIAKPPHFMIGHTPFVSMEVRVVLSGSFAFVGIATDSVAGEGVKQKRETLYKMAGKNMMDLVKSDGWICEVKENQMIVVPTGCVIVMLAAELSHGIGWCLSADKNDRHGRQLQALLNDVSGDTEFCNRLCPASRFHEEFVMGSREARA